SSFSDDRCSASVTPGSCTPTSTALGRGASVGDDMVVLRCFQDNVHRLPKETLCCSRLARPRRADPFRVVGAGSMSLIDGELLAQGQVLEGEMATAADEERDAPEQRE